MKTRSEPEVVEVSFSDPAGHLFRFSRYFDQTTAQWVRHGRFVESTGSGVVLSEGEYRHGREVGVWRDFYPSGKRAAEGEYLDGLEHGLWRFWDEDGNPERSVLYDHGVG